MTPAKESKMVDEETAIREHLVDVVDLDKDELDQEDGQLLEEKLPDELQKDLEQKNPTESPVTCQDPSHIEIANKLAFYRKKARDSKRMLLRLRCQKDDELQSLTTQLLALEGHLRREQKEIQSQLMQRDHMLQAQSQDIEKLRRYNRRLINRLKKFSEVFEGNELENLEPRSKMGRLDSIEEDQSSLSSDRDGCISPTLMLLASPPQFPFTLPNKKSYQIVDVSTSNNLNKMSNGCVEPPTIFQDTVNPDILNIRATTDRVLHKLPRVEKIKMSPQNTRTVPNSGDIATEVHTPHKKACSIVSTISRLLDEESDCTATTGSCNSEPSSPESTVKSVPPRVVRLARRLKESLTQSNLALRWQNSFDTSIESNRQEETDQKSYMSDEHEVTSGYNSDAVSDPDYDSLRFRKKIEVEEVDKKQSTQIIPHTKEKDKETLTEQKGLICLDDGPSNASQALTDQLISESMMSGRNVPRSRQNIKFLINNNGDHMNNNFEEFTLDSMESEENHQSENFHSSTCRDKENIHENPHTENDGMKDPTEKEMDGRSSKSFSTNGAVQGEVMSTKQYEQMVETNNLIQKSILTPTRSLINHRSMLKPRDIKHRNKLRMVCTTLAALEENPITGHKYYVKL
ncbi:unnamed protein product [Meganyctiphanes norvegica]|uniref:Uncharacterized protein n=1 Tax=Meganyctiphanes norvegica TaxID=48144 RepID=A0AAV2Q6R7_MEGNR